MVKAMLIGIFVIVVVCIVLTVYACCVVAGRADQIDEFRSKYTK